MATLALAAAFVGLTSAAPTAGGAESFDSVVKRTNNCACNTIPYILVNLHAEVKLIIADLKVAIGAKVPVDLKVLDPFLVRLKNVIVQATVQIQAISHIGLDLILLQNGRLLTVQACAELFVAVFVDVVLVLDICLNAVLVLEVPAYLIKVLNLSVVITALLEIVFNIILDIKVIFCGLVPADTVTFLTLSGLTKVLGLVTL